MESPPSAQEAMYGKGGGPPMLYDSPKAKPPPRSRKRRKMVPQKNPTTEELVRRIKERSRVSLVDDKDEGSSPADLPGDFPQELAFRALAAYSLLRTLSVKLRLSPFTPTVFLRALYLPYPNKLLGQAHVALLRMLLPQLGYSYKPKGRSFHKRRSLDNVRWPLRGGDNLTYLDGFSWPLFYDDYCHLTADRVWASYNDKRSYLDLRSLDLTPVGLEVYQYTNGSSQDDDDDDSIGTSSDEERGSLSLGQVRQPTNAPGPPLHRSNRAGRNRVYFGLDQSDSDIEFGDNDEVDEEDGSDVEYEHFRKNNGKRKAPRRRHIPRTRLQTVDTQEDLTENSALLFGPETYQRIEKTLNVLPPPGEKANPSLEYDARSVKTKEFESSSHHSQEQPLGTSVMHIRGGGEGLVSLESAIPGGSSSDFVIENNDLPTTSSFRSNEVHIGTKTNVSSPTHGHSRRKLPLRSPDVSRASKASDGSRPTPSLSVSTMNPLQTPLGHSIENTSTLHPLESPLGPSMEKSAEVGYPMRSHNDQRILEMSMNAGNSRVPDIDPRTYHHIEGQDGLLVPSNFGSSMSPVGVKPTRMGLEVDDDVARTLRNFICGKRMEPVEVGKSSESSSSNNSLKDFEQRAEKERWVYFEPLHKLRTGVPYHRLSLEHKLVILEFLIDEVLSIGDIVEELTRRRTVENGYNVAFGIWPNNEEFENLDNGDECGVCNGEGELLCCDGCVRSYHRECLDMSATQELPAGKWLCPECRLVDPALLGPLRAGSKASLDWFSIGGVQTSLLDVVSRHSPDGIRDNCGHVEQSGNCDSCFSEKATEIEASRHELDGLYAVAAAPNPFPDQEFLIVHGYVFQRSANRVESSSVALLSRNLSLDFLGKLDPATKKAWPLIQVPTQEALSSQHFRASKWYMMPVESYDPSFYTSKYSQAPIPTLFPVGGAGSQGRTTAIGDESECYQNSTRRLSEVLTRDFNLDTAISKSLLLEPVLYDPHFIFREYLTRLEAQIRKACLVDEWWEAGTERSPQEAWSQSVRMAKSITRLARLLLQLVDRVHPRAFGDGWFQNQHLKDEEIVPDSLKHFADLPSDWTKEKECQKRIWEKIAPDAILHVCERQGCRLDPFVQGIKEHISPSSMVKRSKRKRAKVFYTVPPSDLKTSSALPIVDTQGSAIAVKTASSTESLSCTQEVALVVSLPIATTKGERVDDRGNSKFDDRKQASVRTEGTIVMAPGQDQKGAGSVLAKDEIVVAETSVQGPDILGRVEIKDKKTITTEGKVTEDLCLVEAGLGRSVSSLRKQLKKGGREGTAVSTRTRTRRSSGRMVAADQELLSEPPPLEGLAHEICHAPSDSIQMQIDLNKIKKIPKVEKIVKGSFQPQQAWPIAGRTPFPPVGNVPPSEMKRLARNAGVVKAPYVAYETSHEVGQVCFAHMWRQETEKCKAHEELALQIRVLESFLDRQTFHSCESVVRRGKNQIQKVIMLSQRDPSNGVVEHFVVSKTTMKGCWISSEHIDVSALILDNFTRRQHQLNKRNEYLKAKADAARQEQGEPIRRAMTNEDRRMPEGTAVRQVQEKTTARPKASLDVAAHRTATHTAPNQGMHQASGLNHAIPSPHSRLTHEAKIWTEISWAILLKHQTDLTTLAKQYLGAGMTMPEYRRDELRKNTLSNLKGIGYLQVPEEQLLREILLTEEEGMRNMNFPNASQHQPATNQHQSLNHSAPPSAVNPWPNSIDWSQTRGFGVNTDSIVDPPSIRQTGVTVGRFPNASQSTGTSWPTDSVSMASSTHDLFNPYGQTLMGGNMSAMPHQGAMPGAPHVQQGFDPAMRRTATTQSYHTPQSHQLLFEQQFQHNPNVQYQQQAQLNQFWSGLRNPQEIETFLQIAGGQIMGQQAFGGQNQFPVPGEQLQRIQQFLQQQQWQNSQSRGPAHPDNNGFW